MQLKNVLITSIIMSLSGCGDIGPRPTDPFPLPMPPMIEQTESQAHAAAKPLVFDNYPVRGAMADSPAPEHVYALIDYSVADNTVTVRNPWGDEGGEYITMPAETFRAEFWAMVLAWPQ